MSGSPVFVRKKGSERFLTMNGIKAQVYKPTAPPDVSLPPDLVPLDTQVAGHAFATSNSDIGLLKHSDGYVLKPVQRRKHGEREVKFYTQVQTSTEPVCVELSKFLPQFLGCTTISVNNKDVECIMLEDVTRGLVEPCIMDIKIGRQTWDPEASPEKMENEKMKYVESKKHFAFCIPGFQVYRTTTGKVMKMGKEFGKRLDKDTMKDALKLFLNAECGGLNRRLVVQFLAELWSILRWCRTQHKYHIYSSSLLLMYDARRLKHAVRKVCGVPDRPMSPVLGRAHSLKLNLGAGAYGSKLTNYGLPSSPTRSSAPPLKLEQAAVSVNGLCRSLSFASPTSPKSFSRPGTPKQERRPNSLFGRPASPVTTLERQLSGGRCSSPTSPSPSLERRLLGGSWHADFEAVCRTHSLVNDYERDLQSMKDNYRFELDELIGSERPGGSDVWVKVRMIDFAHTFPAANDEVDSNYLEGIENLVKIFESLFEEVSL